MRFRATILVKLLLALVVPVVALFTLFAFVAYEVSRRDLDAELGHRLEAIAAAGAMQIRDPKYISKLSEGDEQDDLFTQGVARLTQLGKVTGAHLFMLDEKYGTRGDTDAALAIGTTNHRATLDGSELRRVFAGKTARSVTFQGNDGRWYKTGYAPIHGTGSDTTVYLAVGAQAPASYFDSLTALRKRLLMWGAGLALVSVLAAVMKA